MVKKIFKKHQFIFLLLIITVSLFSITIGAYLKNRVSSSKKKSNSPSTAPPTTSVYYGRSTLGNCVTDDECLVSGCNGEICQSKTEEPLSSICVVPDKPLPKQLGYQCQCFTERCQWVK